jgi:DNA repair photolyase
MAEAQPKTVRGRGSQINPTNRFARLAVEEDPEHLEHDEDAGESRKVATEYYADESKSVVSENDSPDVGFRYSINPYRGCAHGCAYCFARPTHEFLDLSAGLDFETRIFVKQRAPELFRAWLSRKGYQPEPIAISGVTDCYQPIERQLGLTRRLLEVALETRQPVVIVTKNALVRRDLDLLTPLAASNLVRVAVSVTSLEQSLTRVMEPRTSSPAARLETIRRLTQAGVSVQVLLAPVIPGLTEHEMPAILHAVKEAGAASAGYVLLRLPMTVEPVFLEWLKRTHPEKQSRVLALIRSMRGGKLYDGQWGVRMRGTGPIAEQIARTFEVFSCLTHRHIPWRL